MTNNITAISKKISALLEKNSENGATEDEANAAMKIATKLMTEHGITMEDIQKNTAAANDFQEKIINENRKKLHEVDLYGILNAIAKFTDTHVHIERKVKVNSSVYFFGYRSDIELAEYLREVCKRALETEWNKYVMNNVLDGHKRTHRKNFMIGMSQRISERLRDMKQEHTDETKGTQLVVVKNQLVTKAFAEKNIKLKKPQSTTFTMDDSYGAGKLAGNNVSLNKSMADRVSKGVQMITG